MSCGIIESSVEQVPTFEPDNSGFKSGNLSFYLRFKPHKRTPFRTEAEFSSFMSCADAPYCKILYAHPIPLPTLAVFRKDDGKGLLFEGMEKRFAYRAIIWIP